MPIRLTGKGNWSTDVKAGANFCDIALFSFWFNSINFYLSGIDVTTNPEKADNSNTGVADANKPDTGKTDLEEANGVETDTTDIEEVEKQGLGIADPAEADGVEADGAKANKTDKPDTKSIDPANLVKVNGANK